MNMQLKEHETFILDGMIPSSSVECTFFQREMKKVVMFLQVSSSYGIWRVPENHAECS